MQLQNNKPVKDLNPILILAVDVNLPEETIREWVHWCGAKKFGGVAFIGSATWDKPVLDEDWYRKLLDAASHVAKAAEEADLPVWIFDEWGYPSGTAGGFVADNPDYRSKKLHISCDFFLERGETVEFTSPPRLLSLGAIPMNKYNFYSPGGHCKRIKAGPGETVRYTAGTVPERLVGVSWQSISFITHTIQENKDDDYRLGTIDLMNPEAVRRFTEVMHTPYYHKLGKYFGKVIKGFFYDEPEISFHFPWTAGLEKEFAEKKGYDLLDELPLLMAYNGCFYHPGWSEGQSLIRRLTDDYRDVWTERMARVFYGGLRDWCHDHNVLSIGHQDMDHHAETLCSVSGDFFRNSYYNDHPGIDVISDNIDIGGFYDFPRYAGSAKRFGGKERAVSETFAIMGISFYPDRMRYLMEQQIVRGVDEFVLMISMPKPDEPQSICFFPGDLQCETFMEEINRHVAQAAELSLTGKPGASTAVYIPIADIYAVQQMKRDGHVNNMHLPWDKVDDIAEILCYAPCDFVYVWDDMLEMLISGCGIDTVIIPAAVHPNPKAVDILKNFVSAGGKVITVSFPIHGAPFDFVPNPGDVLNFIKTPVKNMNGGRLSLCHRIDGGRDIFMLLNESAKKEEFRLSFTCSDNLTEFSCLEGSLMSGIREKEGNYPFAPGELRVFIAGDGFTPPMAKSFTRFCAIDSVSLTLPNGENKPLDINKLPTWAELGFPEYSGILNYTVTFRSSGKAVCIDLGSLGYAAVVSVDSGKEIKVPFAPFRAEAGILPAGSHTLTIKVMNTNINKYIGTPELEAKLFPNGAPYHFNYDRKNLSSGLYGPVHILEEI
jgi:hypothetical protein